MTTTTLKRAGRYPLLGYFFAAVPAVLAVSGLLLRWVSGAPHPSDVKPSEEPPASAEAAPSPTPAPVSVPSSPAAPAPEGPSAEEVIRTYSEGRVSNARAMAESGGHAELSATLDKFEHHYTLGLEARSAGRRQEALRHLQECLALDRELTRGKSNLTPRLQRQVASLRSKRSK